MYNGIDVAARRFEPVKEDHLAYVGRANRDKAPELAIEAAARLGRRLKMAIKVNEPAEREYFATQVAPRCATADVEVFPHADTTTRDELVATAAALLFPIRWPEPFGLVPPEASACGAPVGAFAEGAVPEVVADGVSGLLVPPGDHDAFCAAVRRAGELDPHACRRHAREQFDAARMVAGYTRLYERITAPGPTSLLAPPGAERVGALSLEDSV